jgi:hypothetical protein
MRAAALGWQVRSHEQGHEAAEYNQKGASQ